MQRKLTASDKLPSNTLETLSKVHSVTDEYSCYENNEQLLEEIIKESEAKLLAFTIFSKLNPQQEISEVLNQEFNNVKKGISETIAHTTILLALVKNISINNDIVLGKISIQDLLSKSSDQLREFKAQMAREILLERKAAKRYLNLGFFVETAPNLSSSERIKAIAMMEAVEKESKSLKKIEKREAAEEATMQGAFATQHMNGPNHR